MSFIHFASILHVFDIRPPIGEDDAPVKLEYRPTDDLMSYVYGQFRITSHIVEPCIFLLACRHIHGYQYIIAPRSPQSECLVSKYMKAD